MRKKWVIFYTIIVLYTIGIIGIAWTTYSNVDISKQSPKIETIKIVFIMIGGLGVILPTYLNIWQSLENSEIRKEEKRYLIIENTFKLIEKWDDKLFFDARKYTRKLKDNENSLSPDQILQQIHNDSDLRQSIILLLNYFDDVRISIKHERIDKEIYKSTLGSVVIDICKRFDVFIKTEDQESQNDIKELLAYLTK
jgi:hypothetical protein